MTISVSIAVADVFHAPHLAKQVHRHGELRQLISAHPRFLVTSFDFPRSAVRSALVPMLSCPALPRAVTWLGTHLSRRDRHDLFDSVAARRLSSQSDIVVAWSGSARRTLTAAKANNQVTALERGSCHILAQRDLLAAEYDEAGVRNGLLPDQRTIDSELAEYELADRVFIPSEFVQQSFVARGIPAERLAKARYGVDSSFFTPAGEPSPNFVVAHVGNLSIRKGVHHLLRAFDDLDLPRSELRLYGGILPEIEPFLEAFGRRVSHVGPVRKDELVHRLSDASVVVLASVEEGLSMALGEAMACARPVICSANTGGADLVDDGATGFIFPAGDLEALKSHLVTLYEDRERAREMGLRAREHVRNITWDAYGDEVWASYVSMLTGHAA